MANSAVFVGDGKEADPNLVKETIEALKQGREIFAEGVGLVKDLRNEAQDVARNLNDWWKNRNPIDPGSQVIIYQHANYGGGVKGLGLGSDISRYSDFHFRQSFGWEDWNDEVSAIKVSGGAVFVAWEHDAYGGNRLVLMPGASISELRHVAGGWHDCISSSKVIKATELDQIFT